MRIVRAGLVERLGFAAVLQQGDGLGRLDPHPVRSGGQLDDQPAAVAAEHQGGERGENAFAEAGVRAAERLGVRDGQRRPAARAGAV
ncbi:hypothetical protein [Amycolatopsis kentuckyensis]|uniref:hypothetical protein n=1 Tax=Amycolatopsis kentuckyensis TaxID=218823 RepID=UPI000A3A52F9|nr:hypothetical protein [Amycolatopsis kentuckyensis]